MPKVLVVDDSLSVRKVVERALAGRHIEVVSAATGSEALERIEREAPDVIVCDVVMPDRDGYEICEFVKRHPTLSRTPVLLMSGIVNDEVRERAARVQSADVLSKPFAAEDLLRKLDALLAPVRREEPPPLVIEERPPMVAVAPPIPALNGHATPPPVLAAPPLAGEPHAIDTPPAVTPRALPKTPANGTAASSGGNAVLKQFAAIEGVQWALLVDREGFLLDASADDAVDAEVAGALSACLAESSEGLGRELGRGALHGMILEFEQGMVVVYRVGVSALLAVGLSEPAVLGKVRYYAKKTIPELLQSV
jgi:CheY-like chemotaxis protein/predicted regulator of Ras-like GTPase activity (Roadblock/LC7/MglB family)